jgi:hypothetical protein
MINMVNMNEAARYAWATLVLTAPVGFASARPTLRISTLEKTIWRQKTNLN